VTLTHLLFDLHGTLVEAARLPAAYAQGVGQVMAARYGGDAARWAQEQRTIADDWDSYYADLDLTGDRGMDDLREGEIRTTRALFRLTGVLLPPADELAALARALPYEAVRGCDVLYPAARPALERLHRAGYTLGAASLSTAALTRGLLEGGGVLHLFNGVLMGADTAGRFVKDAAFYRASGLEPTSCVVVDDSADGLSGARAAGMSAYRVANGDLAPLLVALIPADGTLA
jgi:beta-phosphoglucomutase-like phosphatase (HAD superfamily)